MSEFQEKVNDLKQTFSEPGFIATDDLTPSDEPQEDSVEFSEEAPVEGDVKPRKSKKKIESLKSRIDQLTFEKNVREAQNRELLARVQAQEQLLAEKQFQVEKNEQHKNAYYENGLETRGNSILNELRIAKEEADVEKEVALSKELAKVEAEKSTYNLYKSQLRNQPLPDSSYEPIENQYYPSSPFPQDSFSAQEEPENEVYEEWLDHNQWADPRSSHFSPRLRQEIDGIDAELSDLLRYNGDSHIIGTPEYFSALDNIMKERYVVKGNSSSSGRSQAVAPVSRNGSSMADQYMSSNPNRSRQSTPLTEAEYRIARNLKIKLPNGKYLTGEEAVKRYADAKRSLNPNDTRLIID